MIDRRTLAKGATTTATRLHLAGLHARSIVRAGLADVLEWLGQAPVTEHEPRHARPYEERTVTRQRMCDAREHEVRYYFPLAA